MINWYLSEIVVQEQEVDNQDELLEKKAIAEKVIDRLAYEDSVLIPLNKTGLGGTGAKADQEGGAQAEDPYLVVHPNFVADEGFWVYSVQILNQCAKDNKYFTFQPREVKALMISLIPKSTSGIRVPRYGP